MIATVLDYGAGNLHSLAKALAQVARVRVEPDPARAARAELLVLPGVGAFAAAASHLSPARSRLRDALDSGLPCLGICLGMQLLFEASEEGPGEGLGAVGGRVTRLAARRVPHIGWNTVDGSDPLFDRAPLNTAYFAHSYAGRPERAEQVFGWCQHDGDRFPAAIRSGRVIGVQFHPEKSGASGVRFLAACLEEVAR